jgi:adenine-specific DNA methylase
VTPPAYPKRLIEVDLPIKRISAHAREEKKIRRGHISTLHIWWARRPLAACRAVICAALWPDPADPLCPKSFREEARRLMLTWATAHAGLTSKESFGRLVAIQKIPSKLDDEVELRGVLLDFIADFANWDHSTVKEYLDTSQALTRAAHEALGGAAGTRPLVVDPFAGGGAIPLEALRVGADAFASDLNPIPVLLNKVVLEYIPKYGQRLADEVRKWGEWVKKEAEKELAQFYPKDPDGATPIAYLWARTVKCEGPGCGTEVPLLRSLWLARKASRSVGLELVPHPKAKRVDFKIIVKERDGWVAQDNSKERIANPKLEGTVKRGSATCPCCGYTTPIARVKKQLKAKRGGVHDAILYCVVSTRDREQGRFYRQPGGADHKALVAAATHLERRKKASEGPFSFVPTESTEAYHSFVNRGPIYGMVTWEDYFAPRQALALGTLAALIRAAGQKLQEAEEGEFSAAVQTCLALSFGRILDLANSLCGWTLDTQCVKNLFRRQAIPMVWNFAEGVCVGKSAGSWSVVVERFPDILASLFTHHTTGTVQQADAANHPLPDDSAQAVITDPPYYYSVQYADLSDFFYVWMRRTLFGRHGGLLKPDLTPKAGEIIVQSPGHEFAPDGKNNAFYESHMKQAMTEARRVLEPSGIATVVFAHTSTRGWEALLQALIDAGWVVTGSWPIDTEMASRVIAQGRAVLASSVHIVCRPRENPDGSVRMGEIGDWRDVLAALPKRIHEWMPRLSAEGIVGADAIFACLGPALEIFSRYSKVEKASGEIVALREYLEHVWAAVAKEALAAIFSGADTAGFEEDARLTAMWLWTLSGGATESAGGGVGGEDAKGEEAEDDDDEEAEPGGGKQKAGFTLEYDAARKIAQGLGAHLEDLGTLIEVKSKTARLLPVAERATALFGQPETAVVAAAGKKKRKQLTLGFVADEGSEAKPDSGLDGKLQAKPGTTVLDRVHQAMILFGAGRSEALRRFLVDDGAGKDDRFWRLGQAFAALYPTGTDERRWIEGVMARKKGLGL